MSHARPNASDADDGGTALGLDSRDVGASVPASKCSKSTVDRHTSWFAPCRERYAASCAKHGRSSNAHRSLMYVAMRASYSHKSRSISMKRAVARRPLSTIPPAAAVEGTSSAPLSSKMRSSLRRDHSSTSGTIVVGAASNERTSRNTLLLNAATRLHCPWSFATSDGVTEALLGSVAAASRAGMLANRTASSRNCSWDSSPLISELPPPMLMNHPNKPGVAAPARREHDAAWRCSPPSSQFGSGPMREKSRPSVARWSCLCHASIASSGTRTP